MKSRHKSAQVFLTSMGIDEKIFKVKGQGHSETKRTFAAEAYISTASRRSLVENVSLSFRLLADFIENARSDFSGLQSSLFVLALRQIISSIDLAFPTGLIPWTLGPFNVFILLNGWICLHGVLD